MKSGKNSSLFPAFLIQYTSTSTAAAFGFNNESMKSGKNSSCFPAFLI
jgi:hypothetical protein